MSPTITRIECVGPDRRARRLCFDDDTQPRTTSGAAVREMGLEEGVSIQRDGLEAALAPVELALAKERALQLLGYRERSSGELTRKLTDAGYPVAVAQAVVDRFVDVELVDDARFAEAWARARSAAGYGNRRIARELREKGLSGEQIEAALEPLEDPDEQVARARGALRGLSADTPKGRDNALRRLISKGFDFGIALQAIGREHSDDVEVLDE